MMISRRKKKHKIFPFFSQSKIQKRNKQLKIFFTFFFSSRTIQQSNSKNCINFSSHALRADPIHANVIGIFRRKGRRFFREIFRWRRRGSWSCCCDGIIFFRFSCNFPIRRFLLLFGRQINNFLIWRSWGMMMMMMSRIPGIVRRWEIISRVAIFRRVGGFQIWIGDGGHGDNSEMVCPI